MKIKRDPYWKDFSTEALQFMALLAKTLDKSHLRTPQMWAARAQIETELIDRHVVAEPLSSVLYHKNGY